METDTNINDFDVIVVGGGPAGSTVSTLLQEHGRSVLLIEKAHHPRFHIGESLLPMTLPILNELGIGEEVANIGLIKYGAEFNSSIEENSRQTFYFEFSLAADHPHAYEVRRSEFDEILFRNAASKGVHCLEGTRVTDVIFNTDDTVTIDAVDNDGKARTYRAKFMIDASGRESLLSRKKNLRSKSKKHNSAAIFGHFDNVTRRNGKDAGNISIYWFDHGWFWLIPLQGGCMSVGAVCFPEYLKTRTGSTEDFLWQTIRSVAPVAKRLENATLTGQARATGNFTYSSSRMYGPAGENYLLIGDAYAFIDPVFSSGVHIAMSGAKNAAMTIDSYLASPAQRQQVLRKHQQKIDGALKTFSWLIHRFNSPAMHKLFMAPRNSLQIEQAIISLLAGDLYRDTPVKSRLLLFKAIYYVMSVRNIRSSWALYRKRKRNINMTFESGTTPQNKLD